MRTNGPAGATTIRLPTSNVNSPRNTKLHPSSQVWVWGGIIVPGVVTHGLSVEGDEGAVCDDVREQLFSMLREAVRNAASHSGASKVSVEARTDREGIVGVAEDDGWGFEQKPRERTEAGGLVCHSG